MTIDLLEPEKKIAAHDVVWRKQFTDRNRMERHKFERDTIHRMFDHIPEGLKAEFYKRRRARLKKYFEDE
jgi:hypothetical protein